MRRHAKAPSSGSSARQAPRLGATARGALACAVVLAAFLGSSAPAALAAVGEPPAVEAYAAGPVQSDQTYVNGEINPNESPTYYWFEWGTEDCSVGSCQSLPPVHEAYAGADGIYHFVSRRLTGLSPETTYHFRLVAKNGNGLTEGPDETFITAAPDAGCSNENRRAEQHAEYLPACRAYEMVSPPAKEGADVSGDSYNTRIAADGDAAVFSSLSAFGDVKGAGTFTQYLSERDPASGGTGWSTHGITPLVGGLTIQQNAFGQPPAFEASFTPDLSYGVFRTWTSLTGDPWVSETANFYLQGDLRGGEPTSQLLSNCPLCAETEEPVPPVVSLRPVLAGASRDLSHVIFESFAALAPGASAGSLNLYESVEGEVRLAGVLPDGSPAPESQAGLGAFWRHYTSSMISADGSRVFFTAPNEFGSIAGNVYMREDGATTVQLNKSEKEFPEEPQPARLFLASEDGDRAFFITNEGLVNGDDDGIPDVYMYDLARPEGERLVLLSVGNPAEAAVVVGASSDGHYVYFMTIGQLIANQPPMSTDAGVYLWHDGLVRYVGGYPRVNLEDVSRNSPEGTTGTFNDAQASRVSPDGRYLLFTAQSDTYLKGRGGFPGYDHGAECTYDTTSGGPCRELYLYSADSGRLACVSCGPPGTTADSDALLNERRYWGTSPANWHVSHALADDGRYVFFDTGQSLVPRDTNQASDAYEYDVRSGAVHLLSSGTDPDGSYFLEARDDGRDVLFVTRQRLLGWDTDSSYDLYDARAGGGFPDPAPVPAPCEGESCRAAPAPAPPAAATGPASVEGKGNLPGRRCPKGRHAVKRHGRIVCVKPRKHRKHKRTANDHRRAGR